MRLSAFQASRICSGVVHFFGANSRVWLFGSRVNDQMRGGDIDLYIEPEIQDAASIVDAKLNFLSEMHRALGEQKIDLVLRRNQGEFEIPVYRIAKKTGERLL
jgi:predicted nucleotidyltransferase